MRFILLLLISSALFANEKAEIDPETGLIKAENWEFVKLHCTLCHSASIVTQNHGSQN